MTVTSQTRHHFEGSAGIVVEREKVDRHEGFGHRHTMVARRHAVAASWLNLAKNVSWTTQGRLLAHILRNSFVLTTIPGDPEMGLVLAGMSQQIKVTWLFPTNGATFATLTSAQSIRIRRQERSVITFVTDPVIGLQNQSA